MTDQPEALLLAADLEMRPASYTRDMQIARLLREQHAEIERLRAEVERLDLNGIHSCHDNCERLPCVQRREIERLRASNIKLVGAIDMIRETLHGGNVEDLLLIINRALAEGRKP